MRPTNGQRATARHFVALVAVALLSTVLGVIAYTAYQLFDAVSALGEALG